MTKKQMALCKELAAKADCEGGLAEFLLNYSDAAAFDGLPFHQEAKEFCAAYERLMSKMSDEGFPFL